MARSDEAEDRGAGLYDAPATGPLSGLSPDQVENRLLRAVLDDLKAGGSLPGLTSNRSKAELGERLRRETGLPLRPIARFLGISKSSYEYWGRRLADGSACAPDEADELGGEVERVFREEGRCARGYRFVHARLAEELGRPVSEKVVREAMRRRGLRPVYLRRGRRYSSYAGEIDDAPANLPLRGDGTHDFSPASPNALWASDINRVQAPVRREGLPVAGRRPVRLQAGRVGHRGPAHGRARERVPLPGVRRAAARGGPRRAHRPRLPLPVAGVEVDLRGARPHPLDVQEGQVRGQRRDGGVLREAEERVLPRQGLVRGPGRRVRAEARPLDGVVPLRQAEGVPRGRRGRLGYHRRQEGEARAGGVAGPRKRPHPHSVHKNALSNGAFLLQLSNIQLNMQNDALPIQNLHLHA